jgi:hypothetical protein
MKVIRNEIDELHLEVKCPQADIISILVSAKFFDEIRSTNFSIVEGLLSGMLTILIYFNTDELQKIVNLTAE